ncbi:extracellular solute-binding protein [Enterococcus faecium]|uniref:extracellular solute-binding protein n=1 Tax=Enterococcus faecium TaxID=1352 RepID=UPI000DE81CB8|nr:extracellular solute-binding protein [Enterococcus faecium]ELZ1276086.1 extracellular solute-binding protein [Enterococcus faecium]EME8098796.1 extracellular solute-binding protein [Enterococcus faecium]NTK76524.1 extracellular solute-binding protein [Enterococcus faecium]ROY56257.1 extracellular solute-binding protein [Enterococcus faecium]
MKKITLFASLLAVPFFIAGCGNDSNDSSAQEDGKTEIKITWRNTGDHDKMQKFLEEEFIPNFEKENPDIKVIPASITASEGDYFSKIALSMQSESTAPDIVAEDSFMLNSDANAGYLTPLDDYVKDWEDWSNYTENLKVGSTAQDGKLYAIPGTSDSRGIWYNKNVFKKAGLPEDWQPNNWAEIIEAAEKVKKTQPDVIPFGMGVAKANGESVSMQTFQMLLYGTQDQLFDSETRKWDVNSQGILDSLNFIDEIYNKKKLGPSLSIAINSNYGSVMFQEKFPKDEVAMLLDGFWNQGNWTESGATPVENMTERFGFAAMPTQNGEDPGSVTMSGGWTWAIPAKAKNKEASWRVLQALGGKEEQAKRAIAEGNLTVRDDSAELPEYKEQPFIEEATSFLKNAHFRPADDKYPNVSVEIQNMVEAVATGSKTPEQAAKDYADNVTRIVGEDNIKK